jgi:hypothetical protein
MITDATSGLPADMEFPKANLNSSKDAGRCRPAEGGARLTASASTYSLQTESLNVKYTSRDGDVLEIVAEAARSERKEETYSAASVSMDVRGRKPSGAAGVEVGSVADENAAAAEGATEAATEGAAEDGSVDARLLKLARLRDWAAEVEGELRKQQQKILEEFLKRTGKYMDGGEGRFFVLYAPTQEEIDGTAETEDAGVPEYWNAENTSDRIVHFATQMAEIAGEDSEFAETIIQAVTDGFDQANAMTGPLPGAAGELNEKTRELTFSKLSKWLEERKAKSYNQGAQTEAIITAEVPHGIENHEQ